MPTIYMRKDLYDNIVKMGMNPTVYVNTLIDKQFTTTVEYTPSMVLPDEQVEITSISKAPTKKKVK